MPKTPEQQVFAIYSRKSKFTGKGESIENQIEMCRQYIARCFGQEQADGALVYEDEGFSGGSTKRPNFQRMMKDVHSGKIHTIVCYRLDRLTRNTKDCFEFVEELEHYGAAFISIKENFDLTTPTGRLMFTFVAALAQMERETIADRIRDNLQELAKTGRWLGGNTPLGYESEGTEYCKVDGKKRKTFHLKLIPEEAQLVQMIFSKFLELKSLTKLETYLLNQDYKTRQGKPFSRFAIRELIMNPVYAKADGAMYQYLISNDVHPFSDHENFDGNHGIMAYNRTEQTKGSTTRKKPMEEWVVSVGEHEGIISGEDWIAVQGLLDENKSKSYRWRAGQTNEALLSGLLHCRCGHCMRPKVTNRTTGDGERHFRYLCELKEKSRRHKCSNKDINGNHLDRAVCFEIKKLAEEKLQITLALSLHGVSDEKRKKLMPIAEKYGITELMDACRYYFEKTGRRITFEYALAGGVNDTKEDAEGLITLARSLHAHVNLIPINPVRERDFTPSGKEAVRAFQKKLEEAGVNATLRREMGRDIDGACGQLRRNYAKAEAEEIVRQRRNRRIEGVHNIR